MVSQVNLLVTFITILTCFSIEVHGGVLDKSRVTKNSMVHHTVNPKEVSTKMDSKLPLIASKTKSQSDTQSIPKNIGESINFKRKGKIFSDLSFLTGLGIGSLATSAIIPAGTKLSSSSIAERFQPPPIPTSTNSLTNSSTQPHVTTTGQQFPLTSALPHDLINVLDQTHPHHLSFTDNNLLYHTLKSIQDLLERLKMQPKESSSFDSSTSTASAPASSPQFSFMTNRRTIAWNPEIGNELNESDGTSQVRVFKQSDGYIAGLNCSGLKDIIRETIKETNVFNDRRQAEGMDDTTTESTTMMPDMTTTTMPVTTTQIAPPQPTTIAGSSGYYGGHGQNLNGISLVSPSYPSTSYGYPHSVHNAYGPPIYLADAFHHQHHHHHQPHQEYYNSEIIDEYPSDTSISPGNHYSNVPDQWPIYPPYARARKLSTPENGQLVIGKSGFVPSKTIG